MCITSQQLLIFNLLNFESKTNLLDVIKPIINSHLSFNFKMSG